MLHRFGCKARLVTQKNAFLPHENKTIRTRLAKALQAQGIGLHPGTEIVDVKEGKQEKQDSR